MTPEIERESRERVYDKVDWSETRFRRVYLDGFQDAPALSTASSRAPMTSKTLAIP